PEPRAPRARGLRDAWADPARRCSRSSRGDGCALSVTDLPETPGIRPRGEMRRPRGGLVKVFGTHDEKTLAQLADVARSAARVALMADGHMGYVMPIGGVAAYRDKVSPIGVGVDIACGNAAIRTDLREEAIIGHLDELADDIASTIGFGMA